MYVYDLAFLGNCLAWVSGHQIFPISSILKTTNLPHCIGGHYCLQIQLRCLWLQLCACQTKSNSSGGGKGQQASTTRAIMRQQVATIIQFIPHNCQNDSYLAPIIPQLIHTLHQSYLIWAVTPGKRMKERARRRLQCQQGGRSTLSKVMRRPKKATNRVGGYNWAHKVDPVKWNNGIEPSFSVFKANTYKMCLLCLIVLQMRWKRCACCVLKRWTQYAGCV